MTPQQNPNPAFVPYGFLPNFHKPEISTIRIYVACLAAYNNGHLHGRWIDATRGESHICEQTRAMRAASPIEAAEEWAIHDYEGFEGAPISDKPMTDKTPREAVPNKPKPQNISAYYGAGARHPREQAKKLFYSRDFH